MTTNDKKRNVNIELLRIIGCMLVVAAHYFMNHRLAEDGVSYQIPVILMESFVRSCTPIFFLITGFFLFDREKKVKETIRYVVLKILVPAWIIIFLGNFLDRFLNGQATLLQCLTSPELDLQNLSYSILMWHNGAINAYHIWFLFALAYIYILYPVLKLLCTENPSMTCTRRYVLLISIGYFVCKETFDTIVGHQVFFFPAVFAYWPVVYILLGYEFKRFYETKLQKAEKTFLYQMLGLGLFIAGSLITFGLSYFVDLAGNGAYGEAFIEFSSFGPFVSSVGIFLWGISVRIRNQKVQKVILSMGKNTFVAYLVHLMILIKLRSMGMERAVSDIVGTNPFLNAVICVVIYFVLAMGMAYLYNWIKRVIRLHVRPS